MKCVAVSATSIGRATGLQHLPRPKALACLRIEIARRDGTIPTRDRTARRPRQSGKRIRIEVKKRTVRGVVRYDCAPSVPELRQLSSKAGASIIRMIQAPRGRLVVDQSGMGSYDDPFARRSKAKTKVDVVE